MVIDNSNLIWTIGCPYETDAISVVNPDTMLALTVTSKTFKVIAGRNPQITQYFSRIQ